MRSNYHRSRPAFTLVEMLVVITIIGILVALLIPVLVGVQKNTRNAAIAVEVSELARAVETYKSKNTEPFPDFTSQAAVVKHIAKAYPRNTRNVNAWLNPASPPATQDPRNLDAAEAMVFWLSMLSKNIRDPLSGTGDRNVFYKFDDARLRDIDGDGWMEYYSQYSTDCPYVYFDGRIIRVPNTSPPPAGQPAQIDTYAYAWAVYPSPYTPAAPAPNSTNLTRSYLPPTVSASTVGVVRPYRSNINIDVTRDNYRTWPYGPGNPTQWMSPGQFQIFCAGQDNLFGADISGSTTFKTFPAPNYPLAGFEDEDNLTNFNNKTLGASVP